MAKARETTLFAGSGLRVTMRDYLPEVAAGLNEISGEGEKILQQSINAASLKLAKAERAAIGKRYDWRTGDKQSADLAAIKPYRGKMSGGIRAVGRRRNLAEFQVKPFKISITGSRPAFYSARQLTGSKFTPFLGRGTKSKSFLIKNNEGRVLFVNRNDPEDDTHLSGETGLSVADMIKSKEAFEEASPG